MLVIVSDLHLTDGSNGASLSPGAMHLFAERLHDLALRASWRADGRYRPLEHLEVVLLGDIFDLIHSTRWLESGLRPWDDLTNEANSAAVAAIVEGVLRGNHDVLQILRALSSAGAIRVPPASSAGQPVYGSEETPVAVRFHYMVGNRDWPLHLPGIRYDMLRQKLVHLLGLANRPDQRFPHDATESDELLEVLRSHRVLARHGDIFDPLNFHEERDASSLGDAIVIELLMRFVQQVQGQMGDELPPAVLSGLTELELVRPMLLAPIWVEGLLERSGVRPGQRRQIKQIWDELVDEFLSLPFVRECENGSPFELIDGLQRALTFSKHLSLGWAGRLSEWLHSLRGARDASYGQHALGEPDFRNRRARHIVYGHTHAAESLPLDASFADGYVLNQLYFNAGTWRRVYRPTQWALNEHEFIPHDCLTFLAFFHGDERGGRPFETWTGTLAANPVEVPMHRIDAGRATHAEQQPLQAPRVPPRAPHFRHSLAPSRRAPGAQHG